MPVCVRARVSVSLEAESPATLLYEVAAVARQFQFGNAIAFPNWNCQVLFPLRCRRSMWVHWTWQGESWHHRTAYHT